MQHSPKRKLINLLLILLLVVLPLTSACSDDPDPAPSRSSETSSTPKSVSQSVVNDPNAETWGIYWYLCGTDLETYDGAATLDLMELTSVEIPENVYVIIQTGGTYEWYNDVIDPDYIERYIYDSEGLFLLSQEELTSMGNKHTLADFLDFCLTNYDADNKAVIMWDHGGGSSGGLMYDELFDDEYLTIRDVEEAFSLVVDRDYKKPPFDIIGLDACLMATIDMASALHGYGQYMVASQEFEPGLGWNYQGIMEALAAKPNISPVDLSIAICDTYAEALEEADAATEMTLSVVDLKKMKPLFDAVNNYGQEAILAAFDNQRFFVNYNRSAKASENYGGNTPEQGYYNMVDLGDLVRHTRNLLPENTETILKALDEAVVYNVAGPYRQKSSGLSIFYSYDSDNYSLEQYATGAALPIFVHLYDWSINGNLSNEAKLFINEMQITTDENKYDDLDDLINFDNFTYDLEDYPVYIDNEGYAVLDLGSDIAEMLSSVYFNLFIYFEEDDLTLYLGRDNDIVSDWDEGYFYDNFRGVWGAIDGNLVFMDISYESDDYNLYAIPILLNGEACTLSVAYDFHSKSWEILGARPDNDIYGRASKKLIILEPGDEITTLHYIADLSGDGDFIELEIETFIYTENSAFNEEDLGDGTFIMLFELNDMNNNSFLSNIVFLEVEDGNIDAYIE